MSLSGRRNHPFPLLSRRGIGRMSAFFGLLFLLLLLAFPLLFEFLLAIETRLFFEFGFGGHARGVRRGGGGRSGTGGYEGGDVRRNNISQLGRIGADVLQEVVEDVHVLAEGGAGLEFGNGDGELVDGLGLFVGHEGAATLGGE